MRITRPVLSLLLLFVLLGGCVYYFPHVYDGPTQKVYMPTWQNRTSNLGLDRQIYQTLSRWFQRSKAILLTKNKSEADLILAGEILSIVLPSVSWDANARTTEAKVRLDVRYILKDLNTDEILWEVPRELWTEEFSTRGGASAIAVGEQEALEVIISELSEQIYLGTLERLRKINKEAG